MLPSASDCTYFPVEISIVPLSYLHSVTNPAITQTCTTTYPPTIMPIDSGTLFLLYK
jgi:hypothetical protein